MDIRSAIIDLYHHMEWADATLWDAVLQAPSAASDPALKELFHHLHMVQYGFLGMWSGVSLKEAPPEAVGFPDLPSLCRWGRDYHASVGAYIQKLDTGSLDASMVLPWADEYVAGVKPKATPTTLGETLLQVSLHSTHHRGQAAARFRAAGGTPPTTDFIMWAWLGKPAADWRA
jgi:uncharacterized damage-inducible protein DinB